MFAVLLQCPRDSESETLGVFETEEEARACAVRAGDKLLAKGAALDDFLLFVGQARPDLIWREPADDGQLDS